MGLMKRAEKIAAIFYQDFDVEVQATQWVSTPQWVMDYHEEWLKWAEPMMGVTPSMIENSSDRTTASEIKILREETWHGNMPIHIDYEALRRVL